MPNVWMRVSVIGLASMAGVSAASAQLATRIPLVQGLTMVSALRFPDGDRENVVVVREASPAGVSYRWQLRERRDGGKAQEAELSRFVRRADLVGGHA